MGIVPAQTSLGLLLADKNMATQANQHWKFNMRNMTILAVTSIITAVLTYSFMQEDTVIEQPQEISLQPRTTFDLNTQAKLDELASVLQSYQQVNQDQLQQAHLGQTRLNQTLKDLDVRISSLETVNVKQVTNQAVSHNIEQPKNQTESYNDTSNPESGKTLEIKLSHWMDETLSSGYWDKDSAAQAVEQVATNLANVPGVNLDDMQCADRFCRATFAHESGEPPAIDTLFGTPPFVGEGFTISEADGRVSVYFTEPGTSLEEIQNETLQAVQDEEDF